MGAIKKFFKKLFNVFYLENYEEKFKEELEEKKCTYTLSSVFPSPEIQAIALSALEKTE